MVCCSVLLLLMLFGVLRGEKLMLCFTKVMSPPPFLFVLPILCVLYCGIVGVLWWLASFVSCTVAMSMLLVFMMRASSVIFFCIPLICRILRSCLFCHADCDCWWLVTGVIWGVLGVGSLVVVAIWGVEDVDAQVAGAVWGVLCMG